MTLVTEARNATLPEAVEILKAQHDARHDVVVPAAQLRYENGNLVLPGHGEPELTEDGVTATDLVLRPTANCDLQVAKRLGIPTAYAKRMRGENVPLLDANVNGWLPEHGKNVMVRSLIDEGGRTGIARAFMSDQYNALDNMDFLMGILKAVKETGHPYEFRAVNLTEDSLTLDIVSPAVEALAPELMKGYVSPFGGGKGDELPVLRGGIRFQNSETGGGRLRVVPYVVVLICNNGATMTKFAEDFSFGRVHRGARLAEGAINWSQDTRRAQVEALVAEASDAVRHFLDPVWFKAQVAEIERQALKPIEAGDVIDVIATVSKALAFTDTERDLILGDFIAGAQLTNGGVFQAITATAQRLTSPDRAAHLEDRALDSLALV